MAALYARHPLTSGPRLPPRGGKVPQGAAGDKGGRGTGLGRDGRWGSLGGGRRGGRPRGEGRRGGALECRPASESPAPAPASEKPRRPGTPAGRPAWFARSAGQTPHTRPRPAKIESYQVQSLTSCGAAKGWAERPPKCHPLRASIHVFLPPTRDITPFFDSQGLSADVITVGKELLSTRLHAGP